MYSSKDNSVLRILVTYSSNILVFHLLKYPLAFWYVDYGTETENNQSC